MKEWAGSEGGHNRLRLHAAAVLTPAAVRAVHAAVPGLHAGGVPCGAQVHHKGAAPH